MVPTTLRIAGVPEHFNLPFQLGLERRAFIRAGIDLKWRTVPEGTGAMCDLLLNGEIELAVLVTDGASWKWSGSRTITFGTWPLSSIRSANALSSKH